VSKYGTMLRKCLFINIGFHDPEVAKSGAYTDSLGQEMPVMYSSCGYMVEAADFNFRVQKRDMDHLCFYSLKILALIYFISLI